MSIEQRRHIRFSLDIPAACFIKSGEASETVLSQISIGGCLMIWSPKIYVGDEFRLLVSLPNKNFLPLLCKAIYHSEDVGIGAKFLEITQFEQDLLAKIISQNLEEQGLPLQISPFSQPKKFVRAEEPRITDKRQQTEEILDDVLSVNDRYQI